MKDLELTIFGLIMSVMIINAILFIIFGQKTVRKLRKNPLVKEHLGIEFMSGWDIINIVTALGLPRRLNRKARNSMLAALFADADLLEKHITRSDLILAKIHFNLWVAWATALLILIFLSETGIFK